MAKDDDGHDALSRRDTLRLAAAVGALGAGLGALLEGGEAQAEELKLDQKSLGTVALKVYDLKDDREYALVKTFDLSEFIKLKTRSHKDKRTYSLKFFYIQDKHKDTPELLASHELRVTSTRIKVE